MRYEKRPSDYVAVGVIGVVLFVAFVLALASFGCKSASYDCPPIEAPEVVEVPVPVPCGEIPMPEPPVLQLPHVDLDDPDAILEALASDWHELWRAWLEAENLISAYNGGSE